LGAIHPIGLEPPPPRDAADGVDDLGQHQHQERPVEQLEQRPAVVARDDLRDHLDHGEHQERRRRRDQEERGGQVDEVLGALQQRSERGRVIDHRGSLAGGDTGAASLPRAQHAGRAQACRPCGGAAGAEVP
jgi:hypothetical protein